MLLKDQPVEIIDKIKTRLVFKDGAKDLCFVLKRLGFKLAVVSGGFMPLADFVKDALGLDYAFANTLNISADKKRLLGTVLDPIVNGERKAELLNIIAQIEQIPREQVPVRLIRSMQLATVPMICSC